jgi:hypothetical protein
MTHKLYSPGRITGQKETALLEKMSEWPQENDLEKAILVNVTFFPCEIMAVRFFAVVKILKCLN